MIKNLQEHIIKQTEARTAYKGITSGNVKIKDQGHI